MAEHCLPFISGSGDIISGDATSGDVISDDVISADVIFGDVISGGKPINDPPQIINGWSIYTTNT